MLSYKRLVFQPGFVGGQMTRFWLGMHRCCTYLKRLAALISNILCPDLLLFLRSLLPGNPVSSSEMQHSDDHKPISK